MTELWLISYIVDADSIFNTTLRYIGIENRLLDEYYEKNHGNFSTYCYKPWIVLVKRSLHTLPRRLAVWLYIFRSCQLVEDDLFMIFTESLVLIFRMYMRSSLEMVYTRHYGKIYSSLPTKLKEVISDEKSANLTTKWKIITQLSTLLETALPTILMLKESCTRTALTSTVVCELKALNVSMNFFAKKYRQSGNNENENHKAFSIMWITRMMNFYTE